MIHHLTILNWWFTCKSFFQLWNVNRITLSHTNFQDILDNLSRSSFIQEFIVSPASRFITVPFTQIVCLFKKGESKYQSIHLVYMNNRLTPAFKTNWMNDDSLNDGLKKKKYILPFPSFPLRRKCYIKNKKTWAGTNETCHILVKREMNNWISIFYFHYFELFVNTYIRFTF